MTTDDLSAPLGQTPPRRRRYRLPFTAAQAIATLLGLFLAVFIGFALFNDDPFGGEPIARVAYSPPQADAGKAKPAAAAAPSAPAAPAAPATVTPGPGQQTVTIIDGSSGARHEMVIGAPDGAKADAPGTRAAGAPDAGGGDPRLLENSRYGLIPVAAGALKPFRAYAAASDADRARAATMPCVAIVVSGLGVGAAKTADATMKLPAAVTLAFTPYGADPAKLVARARALRHEVLLQVPMEPFDYPDNDPGPQTLLTSATAEQNIDRMAWHMSRFQGYVGLANFMGGRFLASEAAVQPVMREAAKRGLAFLDDGSAARSAAGAAAEAATLPYARADLAIDSVPTAAEIDRTLGRLEAIAKERGTAIGVASALPVSIERIGAWARQLESRGVLLVPLTTAMLKSKSG